ncbi:hypothetical protein HFO94_00850 [Rhizobium leguminosarum]|uniref:hypothetical protein n=1 Tax=Rhizobium TaxID=379 RepID=UPI0014789732|nr:MULTISPECIES: hypothetical protein [Rhizobium]MBY5352119.1 hypothetical protein [Rhizobium leguminosarum]NNH40716.1 hypothetical protein [Rhizobium laguerreae]
MTAFDGKSAMPEIGISSRHRGDEDGRQVAPCSLSGAEIALELGWTRKMLKRIVLDQVVCT